MMDGAPSTERFVKLPGIVEIRFVSDDPEYYRTPIDLFYEQMNGLPDHYGKKDKQTTVQTMFTCLICECDITGVVPLRAHFKGTQHTRKASRKEMIYNKRKKADAGIGEASTSYAIRKSLWRDDDLDYQDNVRRINRERSRSPRRTKQDCFHREDMEVQVRRDRESHRVKNENLDEDDIVEVSRKGNFENWSTVRNDHGSDVHRSSTETQRMSTSTLEEAINRLHQRVAKHVMENMNKYYPDIDVFDPMLHKIRDVDDYTTTARMLSHNIRAKIKDSYEAYNGTLEGISLTGDHVAFIKTQVEMHFDQIPVIKTFHNNNNNKTFEPVPDENYKQLVSIEEKASDLEKKFAEIDINNIRQSPNIWLHLSEEGLRDSKNQANRMNEEMQKLLETLDGLNLLPDQQGKIFVGADRSPRCDTSIRLSVRHKVVNSTQSWLSGSDL